MVDFTSHVLANPVGREYSFAVRIRGFPYLWTDGKANWTYADAREIIHGGLGKTDWSFEFHSDPQTPLNVGNGLTISLIDEPSRRTRDLFSPNKTPTWKSRLLPSSVGFTPSDTTFSVLDTSGLAADMELYFGTETVTVSSVTNSTDFVVSRGRYGTVKQKYTNRYDGKDDQNLGMEVANVPRVWRGRFVEIFIAPVLEDGTAGTQYTIWAGRLGSFSLTGKAVRISCDTLTASLDKDSWPEPLPTGRTGTDTIRFHLTLDQMFIDFQSDLSAAYAMSSRRAELGTYTSGGTFTKWTTEGNYTIEQIAQGINDTLIYALYDVGGGDSSITNGLAVQAVEITGTRHGTEYNVINLEMVNSTSYFISLKPTGVLARLGAREVFNCRRGETRNILRNSLPRTGYYIKDSDTQFSFLLNDKIDPFIADGCYDENLSSMVGYARISDGSADSVELISFLSAAVDSETGVGSLSGVVRGLGGTKARNWGFVDGQAASVDVKIEQVLNICSGDAMDAGDFLLYLLLSVDGNTQLNDATYDRLGARFGLGYHPDFVDIEGIKSKLRIGDMPRPYMWWVEQPGKGKGSLEEFMKLHGMYFVTRRFERNGQYLFGLSVDTVDAAVSTRYNATVDDSFRLANTSPEVDINERLLINTISLTPLYTFGEKEPGKIFEYSEESIAMYGVSKALEIQATAIFNAFTSTFVGSLADDGKIATAVATACSLRWFGSYAFGNFTLEMECPHVGWSVQAGDRVLLNLTGIPNPDSSDGYSNVACKVYDAKYTFGRKAGAKLVFRITLARACELVPCFEVASMVSNPTVTLEANSFSDPGADPPFSDDSRPVKDIQWFNPSRHSDGLGLRVYLWEEGNFASSLVTMTVTGYDYTNSQLTFSSSLPARITGATARVLGCLADYNDPTLLMAQYAYVGSNDDIPLVGTLDASTADVEAFHWV